MATMLTVDEAYRAVLAARRVGPCDCPDGEVCPHPREAVLRELPRLHPDEAEALALAAWTDPLPAAI
jgi:hypothetical protein